jgi:hypothetical protein
MTVPGSNVVAAQKADKAFDPVRDRDDFKTLLAELEKK